MATDKKKASAKASKRKKVEAPDAETVQVQVLVVPPQFGPEGQNPRRGDWKETHGGVAFQVLRDLCAERGTLEIPLNDYLERLMDPGTYPEIDIKTQGNAGFRDKKHYKHDITKGRLVLETREMVVA